MQRIAIVSSIGLCVSIFTLASASAQSMQKNSGVQSTQPQKMAPARTVHGPKRPSTQVGGVKDKFQALTAGECKQLGGTVHTEKAGLCRSGQYCKTVDESNQKHFVCLSKK